MNSVAILKEIRLRTGDVDGILDSTDKDFADEFWFEYIDGAVNYLDANSITTTTYVVSGTSISPEPTSIDGLLFATWAVHTYLAGDLARKVRNGDLGIRFKTGQDEISTVEAARKIETVAAQAEREFRHLVNMRVSEKSSAASRLQ